MAFAMDDIEGFVSPDTRVQADTLDSLSAAVHPLIHDFISSADQTHDHVRGPDPPAHAHAPGVSSRRTIFNHASPEALKELLDLDLPRHGRGHDGIVKFAAKLLNNSANTWHQGFLDKLYGSTDPVGIVSELILAVLNTNVHVYKVSPALTVVEKTVTKALANMFGFKGPDAGGVSQTGGSGANLSALVMARNCLFPETKTDGSSSRRLVLFTSAHGHYSFEKAAQVCGLGSKAVKSVPVDSQGLMSTSHLKSMIRQSREEGECPFFVNATAGTTVLGSYDPLADIAEICREEKLWYHVDASWGGSVVFSSNHKHKLNGAERANTLTVNPHKMLGVPITCSFLLTNSVTQLHVANTLPAAYLFHSNGDGPSVDGHAEGPPEVWDLADVTLQCGRKGDSLKLAMAWEWYGSAGFAKRIDHAFDVARNMANLVQNSPDLILVSSIPPPCLQVCFYFARNGSLGSDEGENSSRTRRLAEDLLTRDYLIDYAPGRQGLFFRAVISLNTRYKTVEQLIETVVELGRQIA